jgi:MraZ protein
MFPVLTGIPWDKQKKASEMALFLSTYVNKVDKKGRVSVPAPFRAALSAHGDQSMVLFPSFTNACLEGCDLQRMEQLCAGADDLAAFSEEQDELTSLIFAEAQPLSFDQDGRTMIPAQLMEHAGLTTQAAFVGKGRTFQIWQPEAFKAHQSDLKERALSKRPTLPAAGGRAS